MIELRDNIFAIPLRQKDNRWEITSNKLYLWRREQLSDLSIKEIDLPPGSYEILFTTKDCSNENARSLVKSHYSRSATLNTELGHYQSSNSRTTFMDYENGFCTMKTPTESLQSLLKSKGLSAGNYLIVKKIIA